MALEPEPHHGVGRAWADLLAGPPAGAGELAEALAAIGRLLPPELADLRRLRDGQVIVIGFDHDFAGWSGPG